MARPPSDHWRPVWGRLPVGGGPVLGLEKGAGMACVAETGLGRFDTDRDTGHRRPKPRPVAGLHRPAVCVPAARSGGGRAVGLGVAVAGHVGAALLILLAGAGPLLSPTEASAPISVELVTTRPDTAEPVVEPVKAPDQPTPPVPRVTLPTPQVVVAAVPVRPAPPAPRPTPSPANAVPTPQAAPVSPPVAPAAAQAGEASYHAQVLARLREARRYPTAARARRQEGVAQVRFTLDGRGRVLEAALARSSGHAALDREALDTVRRAEPLPAPPAGSELPLALVVDIDFFLGG